VRLSSNFIPERQAGRRRTERWVRVGLIVTCSLGLLALLPATLCLIYAGENAGLLLDLQRQRQASLPARTQLAWLDTETQRLKPTRDITVAAHTNIAKWVGVVKELRDRLPQQDIWLTELNGGPPGFDPEAAAEPPVAGAAAVNPAPPPGAPPAQPQVFTVKGYALRQAAIGEYVESLNRTAAFDHAWLVESRPAEAQPKASGAGRPGKVLEFEVKVALKQPIPEGPQ
jgi:Tfp pilus assembly protein PilN